MNIFAMSEAGVCKTIFVIDDEAALTEVLKVRLEARGYTVHAFNNPLLALKALTALTPDCFIIDLLMPEMDGYALCREIRGQAAFRTTPIILLTAQSTRERKLEGFECGIDEFMGKPYDADELLGRVENLLEKKQTYQDEIQAERAKVLKDTAVTVSHEIMTPLTALSLNIEQISRECGRLGIAAFSEELDTMQKCLVKIEELVIKLQRVTTVATEPYIGDVEMIDLDGSI